MSVQNPQMWTSSGPRSFRTRSSSVSKKAEYRRFWITAAASGSNRRSSSTRSCSSVPTMQCGGNISNSRSSSRWLSLVKMTGVPAASSSSTIRTMRGMAAVHSGLAMFPRRVNPSWTSVTISTRPGMRTPLAGRSSKSIGGRPIRIDRRARTWYVPVSPQEPSAPSRRPKWKRRICMDRRHTGWVRPALVLGVLGVVAAALIISPASAHFEPRHERKHVKKIARRIARRLATTIVQTRVGPTLFIEETELVRFGPISLSATSADQTIGTFGPFTLKAHCDEDPALNLNGELRISTTEAHSAFETEDFGNLDDFGPADGDQPWVEANDTFPDDGSQNYESTFDGQLHATSATGATNLVGNGSVLLNGEASGAPDCLFAGAILVVS